MKRRTQRENEAEMQYDPYPDQQDGWGEDGYPAGDAPEAWEQNGADGPRGHYFGQQEALPDENDGRAEWPDDMTGSFYAPNVGNGAWLGEDLPLPEEKPPRRTIFKPRTRKPSFLLAVIVNSFRMLILLVLLLGLSGVGAVVGVAKAYMETAPVLDLAAIDDQAQTSFIYDANGNQITDYKGSENRIMVSIDTMPLMLQHAFVAVEDARFYTHNGIDIKRIVGAFVTNFVSGSQQGGSTITQQLIKNTLLS
ncbi:MAG: transglycosylase domain-containing protein, partial [Clostridiales bacterium]|nr:transglycosylase domain-containing protein [Clostridiales bacterium]